MSEVEETAKATQEIARAAGKVVEAGEKFGTFISKYIQGPLEQGIGIFEDKLKYMRWERQLRLMQRANELIRTSGSTAPSRPIPMKLAVPLFQAASQGGGGRRCVETAPGPPPECGSRATGGRKRPSL